MDVVPQFKTFTAEGSRLELAARGVLLLCSPWQENGADGLVGAHSRRRIQAILPILDANSLGLLSLPGFEIYFDFSGYSDMAIGSAWMLGIQRPINFNAPFRSRSMSEYWLRNCSEIRCCRDCCDVDCRFVAWTSPYIRISGSAEWHCASGESGLEARRFHWLIQAVIAFLLIATVAISLNIGIDIYCLYRETKGRHLVYGDDRIAKYLSSEHYVPRNFDAILIGSSLISKWDTHGIHTLRTHNESLNGSNFEEQEALVRRAVASPGLKTAFILIHPSMTAEHDFTTVQLTGEERWTRAWLIELAGRLQRLVKRYRKPGSPITDDHGTDFFDDPVHLNATAAERRREE